MGKAEDAIEALGGADNIEEIEAWAVRLRTVFSDSSIVDEGLKAAGTFGVLSAASLLQITVGDQADGPATNNNDIITPGTVAPRGMCRRTGRPRPGTAGDGT
jgi:PTS system N-acetylglucosamine-specific IIB component